MSQRGVRKEKDRGWFFVWQLYWPRRDHLAYVYFAADCLHSPCKLWSKPASFTERSDFLYLVLEGTMLPTVSLLVNLSS